MRNKVHNFTKQLTGSEIVGLNLLADITSSSTAVTITNNLYGWSRVKS